MGTIRAERGSGTVGRSPSVLTRSGAFGVVVLGRHDDAPITLAGTGVAVWDALADPCSIHDLMSRLASTFAVDPARIRADVEPMVEDLVSRGILVRSP